MNPTARLPLTLALTLTLVLLGACGAAGTDADPGPDPPPAPTPPPTIYVDPGIDADACDDYDPAARRCGSGEERAYRTLAAAAAAAVAGDVVALRGGTYREALRPANSGRADAPIVFRNHEGERPVLTGEALSPAIEISGRSYLVIEGLTVEGVRRWLYARDAHRNVLRGNTFRRALDPYGSSKTGLFFERAHFNRLLGNRFEDSTQDHLVLIDSDRNLVEGNVFRAADHALWAIKCGDFNVLRNNDFHNADQKIGEIYDCDGVGFDKDVTAVNATRRNLVEGNVFAYTPSSGDASPYAGIQLAAQQTLVRFNLFHDTTGPGLQMALYGGEATHNTGNRVVHNVFFRTDYAGVELSGNTRYTFGDNVFKNNVFYRSRFVANDTRWSWYTDVLDGRPVQIKTGRTDGFLFEANLIAYDGGDDPYLVVHGVTSARSAPRTVGAWQDALPGRFRGNLTAAPRFRDAEGLDFTPAPDSPLVDAGAFLTQAVGSGRGTALPVDDAGYFYDGYGLPGERGDVIQLQGSDLRARVVAIDDEANVLHLDRELDWQDGQGVAYAYAGTAPDIGGYAP
ncbi:hypothetical protein Ocepr_0339 [Oceanithermus profundus DSM 14977]|uniref:Right handed beta helix domain-containing protein n=1 Tax=Oceanithermus profundus (strain DSM 14977 / NBRC 100410 / VKM B-2274 / 506) TaxID=670487 RepID=E4U5X8_OCEP5|nr:right-handed parallel beta-helix repeat-containing protein [Oceanithermus profundus]ADR35799.1 hypothetical protein Ocepr_0339 [Oceanithermus profundus DSM 14977]